MLGGIRVSVDVVSDPAAAAAAAAKGREAAVLELYRLGSITSGLAGRLLGIDRCSFISLANSRQVASLQVTPDELQEEIGLPEP